MSTTSTLMTVEEFLALPDDGIDRELIRGEVVERGMAIRNEDHSETASLVTISLGLWVRDSNLRLRVLSGEAGFRLRRKPDTTVGIDVAIVAARPKKKRARKSTIVEGPPLVAIEVLSPSDRQGEIRDKVELYLTSGVSLVWIVDPGDRTIKAYRPGQPPELFNDQQQFECQDVLPGFTVPVSELFPDE